MHGPRFSRIGELKKLTENFLIIKYSWYGFPPSKKFPGTQKVGSDAVVEQAHRRADARRMTPAVTFQWVWGVVEHIYAMKPARLAWHHVDLACTRWTNEFTAGSAQDVSRRRAGGAPFAVKSSWGLPGFGFLTLSAGVAAPGAEGWKSRYSRSRPAWRVP